MGWKKKLLDEFIDKSYYFYLDKRFDILKRWRVYCDRHTNLNWSWLTCRSTIANGTLNQEGQQKKQRCWRDPHSFFYSSRKQFTVTHKSNSKKKKKNSVFPFDFAISLLNRWLNFYAHVLKIHHQKDETANRESREQRPR